MNALALSTMYFQRWTDQSDLRPFFTWGRRLGFRRFELSHILTAEALATVDPQAHHIVAVHHPCPASSLGQADQLASRDSASRERAAAALRGTMATARSVSARAIVLHLGRIEDETGDLRRLEFELVSRFRAGQSGTAAYAAVRDRLGSCIAALEARHLQPAVSALRPLAEEAAGHGLLLGLETGYHAADLPSPDGMAALLEQLPTSGAGAWLDTGHVGAQANLGLASFDSWRAAVGERWVGVHFHDVVGLRDHLIPGLGQLDFAALGALLPADIVRTCEVDWYFTDEEVAQGVAHLKAAGVALF